MEPPVRKPKVHENPVFGDKAVFLKTSDETEGRFTLIELELAVNGGNTKHSHESYEEIFTVIEGELCLHVNGEDRVLYKGERYTVLKNVEHYFRNESDTVTKFHVEFRPGQQGFEQTLMIGYGLAKDGLINKKGIPKRFSHLALLITLSDTRMPGMWKFLNPLFRWSARWAIRNGELQKLIDRYCD